MKDNSKHFEKKKISGESVLNDQNLKTKIKSYNSRVQKFVKMLIIIPDEISKGHECIWLSAAITDSVFNSGKHYYPQKLLQQC